MKAERISWKRGVVLRMSDHRLIGGGFGSSQATGPVPFDERQPRDLAQIFVPIGHPRCEHIVEMTKTEHPVWWKFGMSSDGRSGLWVARSWPE